MRTLGRLGDRLLQNGFVYWWMKVIVWWERDGEVAPRFNPLANIIWTGSIPNRIRTLLSYCSRMTHASDPSSVCRKWRLFGSARCASSPLDISLVEWSRSLIIVTHLDDISIRYVAVELARTVSRSKSWAGCWEKRGPATFLWSCVVIALWCPLWSIRHASWLRILPGESVGWPIISSRLA